MRVLSAAIILSAVASPTATADGYGHAPLTPPSVGRAHQRLDRLIENPRRHDDHVVLRAAEGLHALALLGRGLVDMLRHRVEPTKLNRLNRAVCSSVSTTSLRVMTCSTPSGAPDSRNNFSSNCDAPGSTSDGLRMNVLPP